MPFGASRAGLMSVAADDIPDSEDLHARYDFSQEDGSMPVTDQTGNGFDLVTGSYSGTGVSINGVQAGSFDGTDDTVRSDTFSDLGEMMVSMVVDATSPFDSAQVWYQGFTDNGNYIGSGVTDTTWIILSDENTEGSDNPDVNILTGIWENGALRLREDGVETVNLDSDIRPHDIVSLASENPHNDRRYAEGAIGEVLVYENADNSRASDVEQYLADKWGVEI